MSLQVDARSSLDASANGKATRSTVKDMFFKAARLTRGVIPASIKASKLYGKLRGKLQGLLASHNSIYDADNYARYTEPAAVQSAGPISNSIILEFSPKSVIDVGCGTGPC